MSDLPVNLSAGALAKPGDLTPQFGGLMGEFWARSSMGLCLADAQGTIVAVNPSFCSAVGRPAEELVGASTMRLSAPEASVQGAISHTAFIEGDDTALAGTVYVHKNGRPLFTHVTDTRVSALDGQVFRLTTLIDLAGQVQGVGPLREHQRAENFSALATDISNDFNNLLSIILGYTAFLQDSVRDPARLNTAVEGIENAVKRAANLIRQTLHLSRRDELALQRTATGHFVREFYRMTGATLMSGMRFGMNVEDELPAVSLDPQQFHHVLANLFQKSRELAGAGGRMLVSVQRAGGEEVRAKFPEAGGDSYVSVVLRAEPAAAKLADEEDVHRWEDAVQFAERRRDLAVLVVHGIMAGHGGFLDVDARSGPALVFRLYLPALGEPVLEVLPPVVTLAPVPTGGYTVLLVDDEEPLLHTLKTALEKNGFRIFTARDGLEAVTQFMKYAPELSLVLIDLGLPRMSGWEVFQKIKAHDPAMKVVVMSGHLEANLKAKIIKGGACGFLQKPFAIAEGIAEVKRVFAQA